MRTACAAQVCLLAVIVCGCGSGGQDPVATAGETPQPPPERLAPAESAQNPSPPDLEELAAAVGRDPEDANAHRRLAIALFEAGRKDEALPHIERAVELDPTPRRLLDLALVYAGMSRADEAEATYGKILELAPGNPIALHNMGNLALAGGDPARAIELYQQAIASEPDYLLAHYHLGDAFKQANRFKEAYRAYERVLDLEPTNPQELEAYDDSLYRLAMLDLEMGATERAARFLQQLLQAVPDHPDAHYAYGRALTMLGRADEAQLQFETHMRLQALKESSDPAPPRE